MPRAETHCDLSPYLSLHISVCALVAACCSFLPSCTQRRSYGNQDPPPPLAPRRPFTRRHMHMCAQAARVISWAGALSPALGPTNPVCSGACAGPCAQGINNPRTLSAAFRALRWCETIESDLIPTLAFCQQRLRSDEHDGSPALARPAGLCLMQTNRECKKQAGALFSLSEAGMNNSRACHNTPQPCFISSKRCHKVNTSRAIALSFSPRLAARPLLPPSALLLTRPTFCLALPLCRLVSGPAEKAPPAVRSGVIYHSRRRGELTFVQECGCTVVIDSPCLFEDTDSYNYVSPPLSYILPVSLRKAAGR